MMLLISEPEGPSCSSSLAYLFSSVSISSFKGGRVSE
jgi:hypothetical protein